MRSSSLITNGNSTFKFDSYHGHEFLQCDVSGDIDWLHETCQTIIVISDSNDCPGSTTLLLLYRVWENIYPFQ